MQNQNLDVIKSSGEKVKFSLHKLRNSLKRSGADDKAVEYILGIVRDELYQGISTREIYNRAFALLKKKKSVFASKYKLKKAIYELGPTGFPFERFVASILQYSGYHVEIGQVIQGMCVSHEVDVVARKNSDYLVIECKFHSEEGRNCNVKVPLYIHSRFRDIETHHENNGEMIPNHGWVVTNTRFTKDAIQYGKCAGLYLLSWDYPKDNSLKDRVDRLGLYPITVSTFLTNREKQFLLSRDVVLVKQLIEQIFFLDHLGISEQRKQNIINEIKMLCTT
ncbi:ATP cone domain-containing protein [Aquimarina sp. MAR_2010_214]|uniref:restriction endonuclease n=1 Tax=Aquimarina sp. MAR_2010_214 TaxID=1250026 RepID=UPI000C70F067|nr:restriction endonuclease [Aquimarina sp. MAR_2010_214]PKV48280.1 ATP cone domain-containing protein [Aquimarina sp. MAR_2010_214]